VKVGGYNNEEHQNNCKTDIEKYSEQGLRGMSDLMPVSLQDILHRCKSGM